MTLTQIKPAGLSKPIDLADNEQIRLGTGNDLLIYHNGFTSIIGSTSATLGFYSGVNHHFLNADGTETLAKFTTNGSAELYYDNSKKFETTSAGNTLSGTQQNLNGDVKFDNQTNAGMDLRWDESLNSLHFEQDNVKAVFGTGSDLQIYHDGTTSRVHSVSHPLLIKTIDGYDLTLQTNSENAVVCKGNGAVELYYDNSKKLETLSSGVRITSADDAGTGVRGDFLFQQTDGTTIATFDSSHSKIKFEDNRKATFGNADDLQIYHDGSDSYIRSHVTGAIYNRARTNWQVSVNATDGGADDAIKALQNGAVELYYDNVKKFETISDGVQVNGDFKIDNPVNAGDDIFFDASENWMRWDDNVKIQCGNSGDLEIYHDGTSNYIKSISGILKLISPSNTNTEIIVDSDEIAINCIADGAVELYHNDSKKFETTSAGATLTGHLNIAAGNVEFASGNGIDFSAVSDGSRSVSTDGNKLDDYEEGTWTPSLHFGGNTTGITYNNREGSYTKIGRQVTLNWMIDLSSKGSATGDARIYAMPFATANLLTTTSVEANGISAYWNNFEPDLYYMAFFADHAYISIRSQDGNGLSDALNEMTNSDFANNSTFRGSITYFTAS